jgi:hypothetical protein
MAGRGDFGVRKTTFGFAPFSLRAGDEGAKHGSKSFSLQSCLPGDNVKSKRVYAQALTSTLSQREKEQEGWG